MLWYRIMLGIAQLVELWPTDQKVQVLPTQHMSSTLGELCCELRMGVALHAQQSISPRSSTRDRLLCKMADNIAPLIGYRYKTTFKVIHWDERKWLEWVYSRHQPVYARVYPWYYALDLWEMECWRRSAGPIFSSQHSPHIDLNPGPFDPKAGALLKSCSMAWMGIFNNQEGHIFSPSNKGPQPSPTVH